MSTKIFVNLPVKNLPASMDFFKALGYSFNMQFTDETAACMIISDTIYSMLLTHEKFQSFSPNPVCDAHKHTEVLLAVSVESRARVDEMIKIAVSMGGKTFNEPQDHGFMYYHAFQDLDGHIWELMYLDTAITPPD